jgi:hypothetical protein
MLRVVGAGLPRTATRSLKQALELLLGGRCYHMAEVFTHLAAADGWEPLCAALGVPVPDEPFPHTNMRAEWTR